ncbi:hypothetical protein B0H13DRAFT_2572038 [Mycena leptocephala]|nr:hypothetical protein B0H13DRAFT_2572038 [Mycena leptocephala]
MLGISPPLSTFTRLFLLQAFNVVRAPGLPCLTGAYMCVSVFLVIASADLALTDPVLPGSRRRRVVVFELWCRRSLPGFLHGLPDPESAPRFGFFALEIMSCAAWSAMCERRCMIYILNFYLYGGLLPLAPNLATRAGCLTPTKMTLDSTLGSLRVPLISIEQAVRTLQELQTRIQQERASLSLKQQADVVSATSVFDADATWVTSESRVLSRDTSAQRETAVSIQPTSVDKPRDWTQTGTACWWSNGLAGLYDSQTWKDYPGASNIVLWCVQNIPSDAYEDLWHLVIPPLMTLLDDYEARYKLMGAGITSAMLKRVPSSVLKRTGVDSLLLAVRAIDNFITHPSADGAVAVTKSVPHATSESRDSRLLPAAISVSLTLIQLTTSVGSVERFDQLCGLLGDGIIGSIWPYASDRLPALLASIDALPPVLEILGVGCARYMKVLVAQLVHPLAPREYENTSIALQISSLRALSALINACPERMPYWKGTILNGVARCWVGTVDSLDPAPDDLKRELKNVCRTLADACPSVLEEEYPRFLAADATIFEELLPTTR